MAHRTGEGEALQIGEQMFEPLVHVGIAREDGNWFDDGRKTSRDSARRL
jgi:hypothetical protein